MSKRNKAIRIVRIDGKRLALSRAGLVHLAAMARFEGVNLRDLGREQMEEITPVMVNIVASCLHSKRYEISEESSIDWITENLDLDALADSAETIARGIVLGDGGAIPVTYEHGDAFSDLVEEELDRLVSESMPDTVFLGDADIKVVSELFAMCMPKKTDSVK